MPPPSIDVRIVCTYDAVKLAEMLMRLLEAEQHKVRLVYGRRSLADLEHAKTSRGAVVLIWSVNAPTQHYMREWARNIAAGQLIEIARAPGWPQSERKAPVIDFMNWRGERGARAWHALNERLRAIARVMEPRKPPPNRAALALGIASIAAVTGAAMVRMHENELPIAPTETIDQSIAVAESETGVGETDVGESETGVGGPLEAETVEPPSAEDLEALPPLHVTPLEPMHAELGEVAVYRPTRLRPPTLLERIGSLNPLRLLSDDDSSE